MSNLRGDGPIYEAVSRRASPEAHRLIDAMMKEIKDEALNIEKEDMVRALVEVIYPQFPPFLMTEEGAGQLMAKARKNPHKYIDHMRQQAMLGEALAANARGESVAYLLDFLPRKKKGKKRNHGA